MPDKVRTPPLAPPIPTNGRASRSNYKSRSDRPARSGPVRQDIALGSRLGNHRPQQLHPARSSPSPCPQANRWILQLTSASRALASAVALLPRRQVRQRKIPRSKPAHRQPSRPPPAHPRHTASHPAHPERRNAPECVPGVADTPQVTHTTPHPSITYASLWSSRSPAARPRILLAGSPVNASRLSGGFCSSGRLRSLDTQVSTPPNRLLQPTHPPIPHDPHAHASAKFV